MSETCGHHHADGPPGAADVAQAMQAADRRLTAEGERMTPPRLRVLELLLAAGEPVKAYDLIARFGEDGQPAKPPTVYRALEFLERKGLAHRIASISAYVACTSGSIDHAAAFL
ncbi:MAG: transcriptional repressor, partial [Brevundimonas sp.]|nr:transcriptional repressor [Brevundimonas sp.]